jgi:hypothetical protein
MSSVARIKALEGVIREELEAYLKENKIKFRKRKLNELESATASADETQVAKLQQQKADLDKQIAALGVKKAAIMKQIDALEKK